MAWKFEDFTVSRQLKINNFDFGTKNFQTSKRTTNEISFRIIKINWFLDLLSLGLEKKVTDSKGSEYEWVSITLLRPKINVKFWANDNDSVKRFWNSALWYYESSKLKICRFVLPKERMQWFVYSVVFGGLDEGFVTVVISRNNNDSGVFPPITPHNRCSCLT